MFETREQDRTAWCEPAPLAIGKTSLGFVDHIFEIWGALSAGVPLLIVPDEVRQKKKVP